MKYVDVLANDDLGDVLSLTLADEIVRAVRGKPGLGRLARLDEMGRSSRARCIARWQAAAVSRALAVELADDPRVGVIPPEMRPAAEKPLILLLGEIGAGKSLAAERLFQAAVAAARDSGDAPVPVYLQFVHCSSQRLIEAVQAASAGLGNPRVQGATVVIDGGDEAGSGPAAVLLDEARHLVNTWPKTTVMITGRPIPPFGGAEEAARMPLLSEPETYALISRSSGKPVREDWSWEWPRSLSDAVRRPLFALLLAAHLREEDESGPRSLGQLMASLVERSLRRTATDEAHLDQMLQRLGREATDRGGSLVPASEIADGNELRSMLASRLVVQQSGALAFPLPALTEWFAAKSLLAGHPTTMELVGYPTRLEHWRYPLIIAIAMASQEQASAILRPLVEGEPGFAADIVMEGLAGWGIETQIPAPPSLDAGTRIRVAMQAWVNGIGPLAQVIAPLRRDGSLLPIGALSSRFGLTTAWYRAPDVLSDVVQLPTNFNVLHPPPEWCGTKSAHPGRQPAWAWRWALEELTHRLSRVLKARALPTCSVTALREVAWAAACASTGHSRHSRDGIPLKDLERHLSELPASTMMVGGSIQYSLRVVGLEVERLRCAGQDELRDPWPGPDQDSRAGWIWEPYSDERLLDRARAVYAGAVEIYEAVVATWFARLAARLRTAVILPAQLLGFITTSRSDVQRGPVIGWYLKPLPHGSSTVVDLQLRTDAGPRITLGTAFLAEADRHLHSLRAEAASWVHQSVHGQVLDVFSPCPATRIALSWLGDDLKYISWVKGWLDL